MDERAIFKDEEARWKAVLLKLATVAFADGLLDILIGQFSATRHNCGRAPSSAQCQGDSGAVPGGCELAETTVWRHKNPKTDNLDTLRAG